MPRDVTPRTPRNGFVADVENSNGKRVIYERSRTIILEAEKAWDAELVPAREGKITYSEAVKNALRAYDKVLAGKGKSNGNPEH